MKWTTQNKGTVYEHAGYVYYNHAIMQTLYKIVTKEII